MINAGDTDTGIVQDLRAMAVSHLDLMVSTIHIPIISADWFRY
jgi:hypothetical protein